MRNGYLYLHIQKKTVIFGHLLNLLLTHQNHYNYQQTLKYYRNTPVVIYFLKEIIENTEDIKYITTIENSAIAEIIK